MGGKIKVHLTLILCLVGLFGVTRAFEALAVPSCDGNTFTCLYFAPCLMLRHRDLYLDYLTSFDLFWFAARLRDENILEAQH